jgi:hypothetical protein
MKTFDIDSRKIILGGALRRAACHLLGKGSLRYDPLRKACMNDLVFAEIVQVPSRTFEQLITNRLERLYPENAATKLRNEAFQPGPCIAVVGNRYAPPYMIGGLSNPITGELNGEVTGDVIIDSLFGVNVVGFVNREMDYEDRVRVKVKGVLVDSDQRPLNLERFREAMAAPAENFTSARWIVVAGRSTDAGKTTCAWGLVSGLRSLGFKVTMEKKTGTSSCRDWLRCFNHPDATVLERERDEVSFIPAQFPARDFVDGLGAVSDVSVEPDRFVAQSVDYTRAFLAHFQPDFHVIELADSIAHVSNAMLLRSNYYRQQEMTLVYSGIESYEAAAHLVAYVSSLGHGRTPLLLSGPLANENRFVMAREEIRERLGLAICRSAVEKDKRWTPLGRDLAHAVLTRFEVDAPRLLDL